MNQFLLKLTATQQIGAMFVLVFGALLLASIAALLLSLRDRGDDAAADAWRRELSRIDGVLRTSWVMVFVFWVGWLSGDAVTLVLFAGVSFFALREFMTLSPTRRGDHRSLVLAFFIVLPIQYTLVGTRHFDLFTVFIPVYVFLAIPVVSALANDPARFLERNAKLQWGIMVCIYGMSHVPALLLLNFRGFQNRSAFLVFFLVLVVQTCMVVQYLASRRFKSARCAGHQRQLCMAQLVDWRAGGQRARWPAGRSDALCPWAGVGACLCCLRGGIIGPSGDEGAETGPRHSQLGARRRVGHRRRGVAGPGRCTVFCSAHLFSLFQMVFWHLAHIQYAQVAIKIVA